MNEMSVFMGCVSGMLVGPWSRWAGLIDVCETRPLRSRSDREMLQACGFALAASTTAVHLVCVVSKEADFGR